MSILYTLLNNLREPIVSNEALSMQEYPKVTVDACCDAVAQLELCPFDLSVCVAGSTTPLPKGFSLEKLHEEQGEEAMQLSFKVEATSADVAAQIVELLAQGPKELDELKLLYAYKFGTSLTHALKLAGVFPPSIVKAPNERIRAWLQEHSTLVVRGSEVAAVQDVTTMKPHQLAAAVRKLFAPNESAVDMAALAARFMKEYDVGLAAVCGARLQDWFDERPEFVAAGRGQIALA